MVRCEVERSLILGANKTLQRIMQMLLNSLKIYTAPPSFSLIHLVEAADLFVVLMKRKSVNVDFNGKKTRRDFGFAQYLLNKKQRENFMC